MIKKFAERISAAFAATDDATENDAPREHAINMATAVLMTEVARADYDYDESEFELLLDLITRHFGVSPEEAGELANAANETAEDSISLHEFTQLLNKQLTPREKERVVSLLWQVAYADGRLDKYEDSLISRISELLYVTRVRVMRLKHDAGPDADGADAHETG